MGKIQYSNMSRPEFQTAFEVLDIKVGSSLQINELDNLSLWDQLYI